MGINFGMSNITPIDAMGMAGTFLLGLCSLPQLITTFRHKTVEGVSPVMLISCFVGCVLTLIFTLQKDVSTILVLNYLFNSVSYFVLSVAYFMYRKRPSGKH